MANDTILNPGVGGDTIRDILKGSAKTQVVILDYGGLGAEDLTPPPVSTKTPLTAAAPDAATVGATSATVVTANASRTGLVLVNTSTAHISLGFGVDAVLDSGITLYPGGVFCMDEYSFSLDDVTAISSAISANLSIQEYA